MMHRPMPRCLNLQQSHRNHTFIIMTQQKIKLVSTLQNNRNHTFIIMTHQMTLTKRRQTHLSITLIDIAKTFKTINL